MRACSIRSLIEPIRVIAFFSLSQRCIIAESCSERLASSSSIFSNRSFEARSFSRFSACFSTSSCSTRRWTSSISAGTESICMRSRAAASSTRSMALSGRKRSVM